jgi:UDP-N-acetylglucosamine 2-epimerase (non-hydrolysing)
MTKIFLVAAARPNFMKIAPIWHELQKRLDRCEPHLIHTGQHYDKNMSDVFFEDLGLPKPHFHLGVGGGSHAQNTGGVMMEFETICMEHKPDLVVVCGDVNSTIACALTAKKLWIKVAHVESGLRSNDWSMPEEINRLATDAISDYLLTPSRDADENLGREAADAGRVHLVGNIMIDSLVGALDRAKDRATYESFGVEAKQYGLVTLHRPSNVDDPDSLRTIFDNLLTVQAPIIFPVHPRTRKVMAEHGIGEGCDQGEFPVYLADPMPYNDFVNLTMNAKFVLTDSGGIQEETTYLGIPCLTLRPNTERPITITQGTNELVTLDSLPGFLATIMAGEWKTGSVPELWDGKTAARIADVLLEE